MNRQMDGSRPFQLHSDLAVPPGEYLEEILEIQGISLVEFAARSGIPPESIAAIIEGAEPVTASVADRLAALTSVPSNIWLGLEAEYRHACEKTRSDMREADAHG